MSINDVVEWLDERARELDEEELRTILGAISPAAAVVPEVAADEDLLAEAEAAARELTRLLIGSALPAVGPPTEDAAPAVLVSVVRVWARRGIDLRVLMRGYRRAQTEFWRYWMADVAARIEEPALRMAVLEHSWDRVSAWYEAQLDRLEAIYTEERDRWLRGAQARRAELIRSLLAGEPVDREQASLALGYELRRIHTALVLWTEAEQPDALAALEEAVRDLARTAGGGSPLTLPAGSSALWAWIPIDVEPAARAGERSHCRRSSASRPAARRAASTASAAAIRTPSSSGA